MVAGVLRGLLETPVRVETRGGELRIAWAGDGESGADDRARRHRI